MKFLDLGAGYSFEGYANHIANEIEQGRIYKSTGENTFRLTADSTGSPVRHGAREVRARDPDRATSSIRRCWSTSASSPASGTTTSRRAIGTA